MKEKKYIKYYILYSIVLAILLILTLTKGFNSVFIYKIYENNDSDDMIIEGDGSYKRLDILLYNLLSILIINIITIFITLKNKKMKYRKILLFSTILLSMFIPVIYFYRSGGIAGITEEKYITILHLIIQFRYHIILIGIYYIISRGIAFFIERQNKKKIK